MLVTARGLQCRRANLELFADGTYLPLEVSGPKRGRVVAFARRLEGAWAVAVVPRLVSGLAAEGVWPVADEVWRRTWAALPASAPLEWRNIVTVEAFRTRPSRRRGGRDAEPAVAMRGHCVCPTPYRPSPSASWWAGPPPPVRDRRAGAGPTFTNVAFMLPGR